MGIMGGGRGQIQMNLQEILLYQKFNGDKCHDIFQSFECFTNVYTVVSWQQIQTSKLIRCWLWHQIIQKNKFFVGPKLKWSYFKVKVKNYDLHHIFVCKEARSRWTYRKFYFTHWKIFKEILEIVVSLGKVLLNQRPSTIGWALYGFGLNNWTMLRLNQD